MQSPASLRLQRLSIHLSPHFEQIFVQTSDNNQFFKLDEGLLSPVTNFRYVPTNDVRKRRGQQQQSSIFISQKEKQSFYFKFFYKPYNSFPFIYFTGDGGRTYIRESYKSAKKLIKEQGVTHVFSSFRPWADHIVGYRLKKQFPHLVWIADFRDLSIDVVRKDVWWPWLQKRFEQRLLKKANVVTTVSDGLAKQLKPYNQEVVVVRNALPNLPPMMMTAPLSSQFTISYTGSLYPTLQSAELLFKTLRTLLNEGHINPVHLKLEYAGKDGELWQEWASKYTLSYLSVSHGLVSLKEAKAIQAESQINLLLSWSAENYGGIVTAKLADYLVAGRPIIALVEGPGDLEITQLIENTRSGRVFTSEAHDSPEQLRSFLLDAYRSWQFSGALPWQTNPHLLKPYTWAEQVKKLINKL